MVDYGDARGQGPNTLATQFDRLPEGAVAQAPTPIFEWTVPASAVRQRGYQLLVASSRERLDANIGDCWDTRQVRSAQSAQVGYQGSPLRRGRVYHWKVRIWDASNRTTDYSAAEVFRVE